jgi:uncharacterized protein YjbI with pentapeptide repeats
MSSTATIVEIRDIDGKVLFTHQTTVERQASGLAMRDALEAATAARAYLARANLAGAYLVHANLADANLAGAKWRDGVTISRAPLQISGLHWMVFILDQHMQIGCELHTLDDWRSFDDARIAQMDGRHALRFWRAHNAALIALAESDGRGVAAQALEAA